MNIDFQLITPTGHREEAFFLCQKYIERKTFQSNVIWHVTDDGKSESEITFSKNSYKIIRHQIFLPHLFLSVNELPPLSHCIPTYYSLKGAAMLINLFGNFYGPEVIASFSGAMLFAIVQQTFHGLNKLLVFIVSFLMGTAGADTALALLKPYLPEGIHLGKEIGAFVCSALIVSVAMTVITRFEKTAKKERDKEEN